MNLRENMLRVVILGSKPNSKIPHGDRIYGANASFYNRESECAGFRERVMVASGNRLLRGLDDPVISSSFAAKAQMMLQFSGERRVILLPYGPDNITRIRNLEFSRRLDESAINLVSQSDKIDLVKRFVGFYPLVDRSIFEQSPKRWMKDLMRLAHFFVMRYTSVPDRDCPSPYRPSTGLLALLLAISENGGDAEYVISGIGITHRDINVCGDKVNKTWQAKGRLPSHVLADLIVLKKLRGKYKITTTEEQLFSLLPEFVESNNGGNGLANEQR